TEAAYPSYSMRKRIGSFRLLALFRASQNSPSLVVPSPAETYTSPSLRVGLSGTASRCADRSHASAQPTACRNWVPVGLDWLTMCSALWHQWDGICRPPELGSSAAPTADSSISVGVMPSRRQRARSR